MIRPVGVESEAKVLFNKKKAEETEKFNEVYSEFTKNVPEQTSTVKEKREAINYIDRLLKCPDIPNEAKEYWSKQKNVITGEMTKLQFDELTNLYKFSGIYL